MSNIHPPNALDSTSARLLTRLRANDAKAWRQMVHLYGPVVRYWLRRSAVNETDLAELFQETFLASSLNIAQFQRQPGKAKFRAWLKTIVSNKLNDYYRRQRKQPEVIGGTSFLQRLDEIPDGVMLSDCEEDVEQTEDSGLAGSETSFLVRRMVEVVKSEFRANTWQAFYRTAVDGQSSRAVADELDMNPAAVRRAKFRVLKRLREALGGDIPEHESHGPPADK